MRTELIKCTLTFDFPIDKPDLNGVTYTKEAVENALKDLSNNGNIPLLAVGNIKRNENEAEVFLDDIVGKLDSVNYVMYNKEDNSLQVEIGATVFYGGTACDGVEFDENGKISKFNIREFGICY